MAVGDVVFYFTNFRRISFLIPSGSLRATLGIYMYTKIHQITK
jgi:hypothetical protein